MDQALLDFTGMRELAEKGGERGEEAVEICLGKSPHS